MTDPWEPLVERFVGNHYSSLHGRVRAHVVGRHLTEHLPPPPAPIVDVGGGAGTLSIPLARRGHELTIVDSSPAMLERAEEALAAEGEATRRRVRLVEGRGQDLRGSWDAVLCHGVVMYVDDPDELVGPLCRATAPGGVVSIVAKNRDALAVRPAAEGRWADALAAFDTEREVNRLGLETRADTVAGLSALFERHGVSPVAWYGVRLFTDNTPDGTVVDDEESCFAVELEASRRDPYRRLSRLFHLVGRRR